MIAGSAEDQRVLRDVIAMYYREHGVPHFHATYAGETVVVSIETGEVLAGTVAPRALRLVLEWAGLHRDELRSNWAGRVRMLRWRASSRSPSISSMDLAPHLSRVTDVKVVAEHRLHITFEDGLSGEVDASKWEWRGVFEPLRDPDYFARVELDRELGTLTWPNGADVAPETLHLWVADQHKRLSA
jgi:hypothetical protein